MLGDEKSPSWRWPLVLVLAIPTSTLAADGVPQPAESARQSAAQAAADETAPPPATEPHYRSWEAPVYEAVVTTQRDLTEEELIGDYGQPRWTARRRFPTTRVFVVPPGTVSLEWWLDSKTELADPRGTRFRSQYEIEIGLGRRLQLDLYLTTEQDGVAAPFRLHREKVELRYALADWGVIPLNPTLYLELIRQHDAPPKAEGKLLLGTELARRWHAGANLIFERELGAMFEHEYALTLALSYTVIDMVFSLGGELKGALVDRRGARFDPNAIELTGGPSLQWRPVPAVHVDLVVLVGAELARNNGQTDSTALVQQLLVVGWEL